MAMYDNLVMALNMSIYRQKKTLEDETKPHIKDQYVGPPYCLEYAAIVVFLGQYQGFRSLILLCCFVQL